MRKHSIKHTKDYTIAYQSIPNELLCHASVSLVPRRSARKRRTMRSWIGWSNLIWSTSAWQLGCRICVSVSVFLSRTLVHMFPSPPEWVVVLRAASFSFIDTDTYCFAGTVQEAHYRYYWEAHGSSRWMKFSERVDVCYFSGQLWRSFLSHRGQNDPPTRCTGRASRTNPAVWHTRCIL